MSELISLTIAEAREKLSAGEFTSLELTEAYLEAIESANDVFNRSPKRCCRTPIAIAMPSSFPD